MIDINAVEIHNVTKRYPGTVAVSNISFAVGLGEVHGFLGPNGAGKSTTMRMITGLIPQTSGSISIFGKDIHNNPEVQQHVGFLPEQPPLYLNMKVIDYLDFVCSLHEVKDKSFRDLAIEKCGLGQVLGRIIGNLSKGFRQRVGIAATLVHNPKLVIFDEPTVGLDPAAIDEIRNLILSLKEDHTIFLSTHHLHEVELLCSHITVINDGQILQTGTLDKIKENFITKQTILLEVKNWDEKWMADLPFSDLQIETNEGMIRLSTSDKEDIRPKLCAALVSMGAELLSVNKEKAHVEDIFRNLTVRPK